MLTTTPFPGLQRLLHLEDNLTDAMLVARQITHEWPGCEIKRVDTRAEFMQALIEDKYDVILSDFSLPSFDGMEALHLVREYSPATPFLFLSGTIGEDNAVLALQRGAIDYVLKDRPARLIPAIRTALEQRREHILRRQAERRLNEQAEVLDKAHDAICVTDAAGFVTYCNQSANQMFGWTTEEGPGRKLQEMFGPANQALMPVALSELHARGAWTREMQLASGRGSPVSIVSRWTLVRDDRGQPKSILLINTDITEQKKLEAQLLRAQRIEGIGTLAGGIAHDLNNVLTPILMSVNLLRSTQTDPEMLRMLTVLEKSTQHGAALIGQVLAFARGAEGEREEIYPQLVIQDVVMLLKETLPRAITIDTGFAPDLWPVIANATQLGQVLMNLGVNARDAMMGTGRLGIQASNVLVSDAMASTFPGSQSGPHVLITVEDSGSGIPPELLDRIFDPFFTTKTAGKGTGLGLSTVLGIMKGHGGFLQVQSETGHGTKFSLYFPAVRPKSDETATPVVSPPLRGRGETILIIDDEESIRHVAATVLRAHGYKILLAKSGVEGLAIYREKQAEIAAILTDMMMPVMQGAEVIEQARALNPDVRIVAMSGVLDGQSELPTGKGRFAFLAKPMTAESLVRAIQGVLA